MSRRKVKITGVGPVTPAGIGRENFFAGINESVSRVRRVTRFTPPTGERYVAAEVSGFKLSDYATVDGEKRIALHSQFAIAGTQLAIADAGMTVNQFDGRSPVVASGSSLMDIKSFYETFHGVASHGPRGAKIAVIYEAPTIAVAGHIAQLLETACRTIALQSACCSGIDAFAHGTEMVATGQTDLAVVCGTEAPVLYQPMLEFGLARLSPQNDEAPESMCRPFDLWRTTGVIGEGAAVCILEPEGSPRRGYAWITGYAYANDPSASDFSSGLQNTMLMALANARRQPEDVDLINAWGPGHPVVDRVEAQCLRAVFGKRLARIPAVSIKGAVGNPLGAAGSIQVVSAALSLKEGICPPTVNWLTPDPECPLNLSASARRLRSRVAIVNAHGLAGTNATLVMEECHE